MTWCALIVVSLCQTPSRDWFASRECQFELRSGRFAGRFAWSGGLPSSSVSWWKAGVAAVDPVVACIRIIRIPLVIMANRVTFGIRHHLKDVRVGSDDTGIICTYRPYRTSAQDTKWRLSLRPDLSRSARPCPP